MGFLDKLSAGSAKVAEKAKEGVEIASLTAAVEKEKMAMEKIYNEIGKKMYADHKTELEAMFPDEVAKLDESAKKIEDNKEAIRTKKGGVLCPGCGKTVDKGTKFCPACGAVIPEPVAEEVKEEAEEEPVEEEKTEE